MSILLMLVVVIAMLAALYRTQIVQFVRQHQKRVTAAALVAVATAASTAPSGFTFAQESPTIEIPMSELFSSINTWIGVFLPILGIGGGIVIGIALINLVINMIRKALQQAGSGK